MSSVDEAGAESPVIVARAVRTKGLKGEVLAEVLTDFPERFEQISELSAHGPHGELKQLKLERFSLQSGRVVLKFFGYDTIEAAATLVRFEFGVPEAERVQLSAGEFYDWELQGCSVETKDGSVIGSVREVLRTGGVELIAVETSAGRDVLIPMTQAIVLEVDTLQKRILVDPPEGLLDL